LNVVFFIANIFILRFSGGVVFAQDAVEELQAEGKSLPAARINSASILDGKLDADVVHKAELITNFHQSRSGDHAPQFRLTELYVLYTAHVLYVGARMADSGLFQTGFVGINMQRVKVIDCGLQTEVLAAASYNSKPHHETG
jgi:hypothetical protein